jgi:hypothetical protein
LEKFKVRISRLLMGLLVLPLATACGGGGGGSSSTPPPVVVAPPPTPDPTGLWVNSETDGATEGAGLADYTAKLTRIGMTRSATGGPVFEAAPVADTSAGGSGFSTTYTLEADVDEYDIVKYNGSTLAVAPSRSGCCFVVEPRITSDALPPPQEGQGESEIALYQTDPGSGSATAAGIIALQEGQTAEGMYLSESRLQVLLSTAWWGAFGEQFTTSDGWLDEQVSLLNYDLTDVENPVLTNTMTVEGALIASRRAGDEIFVVSRHAPNIEGLVSYPQTEEEVANNEALLAETSESDILPEVRIDGEIIEPLTLDSCYRVDPEHPLAEPVPSDSTLTTFLAISAETGEVLRAACTFEPVSGIYMGSSFIALTHVRWDLEQRGTLVHLMARDSFDYLGSELIDGDLYSGGNADFRISESGGVLRLVTTEWTGDPEDAFTHRLFTLSPSDTAPELDVLGVLGDDPQARIGKPNEDLYGVRFMGNRAYMVTFERIDPLYVIDLSDPSQPSIVGELEVPGFSDLLHEVSDDLLLGLGSSDRFFPKLELYNVSDVTSPISQGLVELGEEMDWSYSPAQYNRYAFTYLAGNETDRLTVPYVASGLRDDEYQHIERIALFEITNKNEPDAAAVLPVGEVTLEPNSVDGDTRVILDNEALYVISHTDLLGGFWSNPEAVSSLRR